MKIVKEFKEFAIKGNALELAVGVIIGGAFGKIVTSLVNDIIMPPLGILIGGINFSSLKLTLREPELAAGGKVIREAVTFNYGNFIQALIDFAIIAFVIFLMIKMVNNVRRNEKEAPLPAPAVPPEDIRLLREIRDLLAKK